MEQKKKNNSDFLNSYRIIGLLFLLGAIGDIILYSTGLISFKMGFVFSIFISLFTIICFLINYIIDITNSKNEEIKIKNDIIMIQTKGIFDFTLVNSFLMNMCNKAREIIDYSEWKDEWDLFVKNMKENNKKYNDLFNLGVKQNEKVNIDDLKQTLKYFEKQENYEECKKIIDKINELEKK